ncbi:aminotransferase class V-fold PLP-dependent enzyme [Fulvivirgaceae bacterium BMA10]|uniref:phosphoserine transaminase n=1 Tax=Splendidivirga corallicola TaxID=3051826 RepID=A0ABT8KJI3_9BACT|nr:aminotransferase class V-fold PLP-dependent enzyme [Fulvivirgaceae bacterium BMA10]
MLNFYPGPSRVYPKLPEFIYDAYREGILGINHRSPQFVDISKTCVKQLRKKLNIPKDYSVFYTSSATECWEIIAQSLIEKKSFHLYNGAFGEKWHDYTKKILPAVSGFKFDLENAIEVEKLAISGDSELICITQNETSNGTQVSNETIQSIGARYPEKLIAIDATSSMAGLELDISSADVWYASVQKCFGLPAGLAVLICSPRTIERALELNHDQYYNSLTFMVEKMKDFQTTHTPNVLGIYLLMRILKSVPNIKVVHEKITQRFEEWIEFLGGFKTFDLFIENTSVRSQTVIPITAETKVLEHIKDLAEKHDIIIGNGYGDLKHQTLRIANFPAIKRKEIRTFQKFLKKSFN